MTDQMDLAGIVRAIDVARVEGRALVLMKTPAGLFSTLENGVENRVLCLTVARAICAQIEAKLPGVAAIPVPIGFEVEVHDAGASP